MSELPDLDEDISFIVDGGVSVGPVSMRDIVQSIQAGERAPSSLVWWAGATDWSRFDSHDGLISLVTLKPQAPVETDRWGLAKEAEPVVDPQPVTKPASAAEVTLEPVAEPELLAEPVVAEEPVAVAEPELLAEPVVAEEPVAVAEPELLAEPVVAEEPVAVAEPVAAEEPAPAEADAPGEGGAEFSFGLPKREVQSEPAEVFPAAQITGLFSAGARDDAGVTATTNATSTPSPDALDAIVAARMSLESVGARIEALSSATKRSMSSEEVKAGLAEIEESGTTLTDPAPPEAVVEPVEAEQDADVVAAGSWTAVEDVAPTAEAGAVGAGDTDVNRGAMAERFDEMVRKSVEHQRRIEWVMRVDELLLSACITAIADSGFVANDLTSRESDHCVLFDHNDDSRKVRLDLSPLDSVVDHLGRHVRFGLSWGRDVADIDGAFEIVRAHSTDGEAQPGVVLCQADVATSSVSTRVELILAADDFVKEDYAVDRHSLDAAIAATLHALEKRWHELFDSV